MPKVNSDELQRFGDPLQSDFFELIIPNVPGAPMGAADILRIGCQQVSLPSKLLEVVQKELAGNQLQYAGRSLTEHDVTTTFMENRNMDVHRSLRNALEFTRRQRTQVGNYKSAYARRALLNVFDQMGMQVDSFILHNLWLNILGELAFDGTGSNSVMIQATWQIDFWEPASGWSV